MQRNDSRFDVQLENYPNSDGTIEDDVNLGGSSGMKNFCCSSIILQKHYNTMKGSMKKVEDYGKFIILERIMPIGQPFWSDTLSLIIFFKALFFFLWSIYALASETHTIAICRFSFSLLYLLCSCCDVIVNVLAIHRCSILKAYFKLKNICEEIKNKACCQYILKVSSELDAKNKENEEQSKKCCSCMYTNETLGKVNFIRIIVTEMFSLLLLYCSLVENAILHTYEGNRTKKSKFGLFVFTAIMYVFTVYILRLFLVCYTIYDLHKAQKLSTPNKSLIDTVNGQNTASINNNEYGSINYLIRVSGLLVFFLFHFFGQMVTQVTFLSAVWIKVQCENHGEDLMSINFTWMTYALFTETYVLPIIGTLTFFIATQYWTREYPINFVLSIIDNMIKKNKLAESKEKSVSSDITNNELTSAKQNIENQRKQRRFISKFCYPFGSPVAILISIVYLTLIVIFMFSFNVTFSDEGEYIYCEFSQAFNGTQKKDIFVSVDIPDVGKQVGRSVVTASPVAIYFALFTPFRIFAYAFQSNYGRLVIIVTLIANIANFVVTAIAVLWVFILIPLFLFIVFNPTMWVLIACIYFFCFHEKLNKTSQK